MCPKNSRFFVEPLTVPELDGKVGTKGCIYCSKSGSGEYGGNVLDDLVTQFNKVKVNHVGKDNYIAKVSKEAKYNKKTNSIIIKKEAAYWR